MLKIINIIMPCLCIFCTVLCGIKALEGSTFSLFASCFAAFSAGVSIGMNVTLYMWQKTIKGL